MSTKFYGKSQEIAARIMEQFKSGNVVKPLAQVFVQRSDNIPSMHWSWRNQFIKAIFGTADARGFRQWETAGRKVKKGAGAFHILGPCTVKVEKTNEDTGETAEDFALIGFKSIPVFRLEDTEIKDPAKWEKNSGIDEEEENRLKSLPMAEVAEKWGIKLTSFNGQKASALGYYRHGEAIALGVENLATWAHELVHAADDRNGTIWKGMGQNPSNEIVAELGGAVLLSAMGYETEADLGGCWEYIQNYGGAGLSAINKAMGLIDRVCACVDLIIRTAGGEEIAPKASKQEKPALAAKVKDGDYKGKALIAYQQYRELVDGLTDAQREKCVDLIADRPAGPALAMVKIKKRLA